MTIVKVCFDPDLTFAHVQELVSRPELWFIASLLDVVILIKILKDVSLFTNFPKTNIVENNGSQK